MRNWSIGSLYRKYRVCRYRCTSYWASIERQQCVNRASTERQQSINTVSTECPQSVNAFGCCIMGNPRALLRHRPISHVLAAILRKWDCDMVTTPVWKWASTERQQFRVLHLVWSEGWATALLHNWSIGSLYRQYRVCRYCYTSKWASTAHQLSINRASTELQHSVNRVSTECQRFWVLHHAYSKGTAMAYVHNQGIGSHSVQMRSWHGHNTCLNMSVNRGSTISCVATCIIHGLCYGIYP